VDITNGGVEVYWIEFCIFKVYLVGKTQSNKLTTSYNAIVDNIKWKGCLTHIAISNVKTTLPGMGG